MLLVLFFYFKQQTGYDVRISAWSSDVCSSDLLIERQPHLEPVLAHAQIPIAVLDDDGHFLGEAFQQVAGNVHAGRAGAEGDVEMMAAGQAASGLHLAKHAADDGAQRIRSEEHTSELQSLMRISFAVFRL